MYSAYKINQLGDNIQPWCTPFPIWNQSVVPCLVLTVASWPAYRFLNRQGKVVWYSDLLRNFPQFVVIHTIKDFGIVNETEVDVLGELSCFSMTQWMLAIWSLVPLPFLKPAWTSGSSWFTYCWSLAWRILSITLLVCEMSAIVWWFGHSSALEWKECDLEAGKWFGTVLCKCDKSPQSCSTLWPYGL